MGSPTGNIDGSLPCRDFSKTYASGGDHNSRVPLTSRAPFVALIVFMSVAMQNDRHDDASRFLVIARERLRPGREAAYHKNEVRIATICATLNCPHPYVALATDTLRLIRSGGHHPKGGYDGQNGIRQVGTARPTAVH
jgi:hypothetical protein